MPKNSRKSSALLSSSYSWSDNSMDMANLLIPGYDCSMKHPQFGFPWGPFETAHKRAHPSEYRGGFVGLGFETQPSQCVGNRPGPGMFAEDDAMLTPQESGIDPLVVEAILEQAIDVDASLMGKNAGADEALLPGDL